MADFSFTQTGAEIQAILDKPENVFFEATQSYSIGDRRQYLNEWYIATSVVAAGAFDPLEWIKVGVTTLYEDLATGLSDLGTATLARTIVDFDEIRVMSLGSGNKAASNELDGLSSSVFKPIDNQKYVIQSSFADATANKCTTSFAVASGTGFTAHIESLDANNYTGVIVGVYGIKY